MDLADSIRKVEESSQLANASLPPIPGRMLLVDGDGLAYSCAGSDDTDPGQARINVLTKIEAAMRAGRCERACILLTMPGSHKGHRFAVATVKAYQGQRSSGRRPKNWAYLRNLLENSKLPYPIVRTYTAEADDLFGRAGKSLGWDNVVILTEDKDMQMVPGHHLSWRDLNYVWVPEDAWEINAHGKVFGRKWFWLQMLQGDTADNVPGLPGFFDAKGAFKPVGPKTAEKFLADCKDEFEARATVLGLYRNTYDDKAGEHLAEQAVLLWMRRDAYSSWMDVFRPGHPLDGWALDPAFQEIARRVEEADKLNIGVTVCPPCPES